ncbi:MAG: hypothetical protein JNK64_20435 [Myxococcales bacterium]|nr:hypothetical protein [Myxococcales bacterium]
MRAALILVLIAGCASGTVAGADDAREADAAAGDPDAAAAIDASTSTPDAATDAAACANTPCDIYSQCGCTAATPVCDLDPNNLPTGATACRVDQFGGGEATLCTRSTTCLAGHSCVGGRCRTFCQDDATCPGEGGLCILTVTTGSTTIPGVTMCTTDCAPPSTTNATCPAGWACHVYSDQATSRFLTDCNAPPASGGGVGAACTGNPSCAPGLDCVNLTPGGMQCRPTCLCPGGNCAAGTCAGGTGSCRPFSTPVIIGGAQYGACF